MGPGRRLPYNRTRISLTFPQDHVCGLNLFENVARTTLPLDDDRAVSSELHIQPPFVAALGLIDLDAEPHDVLLLLMLSKTKLPPRRSTRLNSFLSAGAQESRLFEGYVFST